MRRSSISSQGSSSSTGASIELSRFVNGPSFIGRELARRIVLMSTILGPGSDGAAENDAWSGVVMSLLGHSCTVRFFRWVESTYVPQYLSSAYSGLRSSQLEADGTMRSMMSMSSLSAACRDLFYIRQLLCEIFVLFFRVSERGRVVERYADDIQWGMVSALVSSSRYHRYLFDHRLMEYVGCLHFRSDPFGSRVLLRGSTFLHFICRQNHEYLPRVISEYHRFNVQFGGDIHARQRHHKYGSPAHHFRRFHDIHTHGNHSDMFASGSSTFELLRELFRGGEAFNRSIYDGDDYGQV